MKSYLYWCSLMSLSNKIGNSFAVLNRGEAGGDSTPEGALEPRPGWDGSHRGESLMLLSANDEARLEGMNTSLVRSECFSV